MNSLKRSLCLILLLAASSAVHIALAQSAEDEDSGANAGALAAKRLSSRDPLIRQRAAEELAELADAGQRKLLEGYRLQEKNARVKLALDWALYRIGKREALFTIVQSLDSSRFDQANAYLTQLETPEPLYLFLERMNGNTQAKLIEVLAKIGDAETLDKLKAYSESFDPKIAEAAQHAMREIEQRIGQMPADNSTRPRQVGGGETSP